MRKAHTRCRQALGEASQVLTQGAQQSPPLSCLRRPRCTLRGAREGAVEVSNRWPGHRCLVPNQQALG